MKNTVKKLITIITLAIALLLITVLMMTALGVVSAEALDNTVVKTLLYVLAGTFLVTGAVEIYYAFRSEDAIKAVLLRCGVTESSSISRKVITNVIKRAFVDEKSIKIKSIKLYADNRGPYVTVIVNATTNDVPYTLEYVQRLVKTALLDVLSLTLNHIEVRLKKLSSTVHVDRGSILRDMASQSTEKAMEKVASTLSTEPETTTEDSESTDPIDSTVDEREYTTTSEPTYEDYVEGIMYRE